MRTLPGVSPASLLKALQATKEAVELADSQAQENALLQFKLRKLSDTVQEQRGWIERTRTALETALRQRDDYLAEVRRLKALLPTDQAVNTDRPPTYEAP